MKGAVVLVAVIIATIAVIGSGAFRKKPMCEMCENLIKKIDEVLEQGGDVEKAVDQFCREDLPEFLVEYCEKIVAKNLKYIIEKLKDHDPPEKICTDIYLCTA
ncbi:Saposin-like type B, region 1 [Teladorsagia circumcincta]|uniref:Saposin-like type B, region 1 n=1 Tax=Teladorsagia circumcincta TaxID=45464 RepID=A0A2G9UZZ6_TELCI|nr:Saposin-like type B, region 1 [Teladorsagia circumcincta]